MRFVRGRADARLLPSRHNFALFRLVAFLRLRRASPRASNMMLAVDRHQSAPETYLVASWYMATASCFAAAALFSEWPLPLGLVMGVASVATAIQLVIPAIGGAVGAWNRLNGPAMDGRRLTSVTLMLLVLISAWMLKGSDSWVRFVAWQFLVVSGMNALAAVTILFLHDAISRLEAAVGGETSEG